MLVNPDFAPCEHAPTKLADGIYESNWLFNLPWDTPNREKFCDWPKFDSFKSSYGSSYGTCDNVQQILDEYPELQDPNRQFMVLLQKVVRAEQPSQGGWRWHKWGPYLGSFEPEHEYIYDETGIEQVLIYRIYEWMGN